MYQRIFKRFREIGDPGFVPKTMTSTDAAKLRLPFSCLEKIPELKVIKKKNLFI